MAKLQIEGVIPPMITPFTEKGDVDYDKHISNMERWNQDRLAGYLVLGSNSEAAYLSEAEKKISEGLGKPIDEARDRITSTDGVQGALDQVNTIAIEMAIATGLGVPLSESIDLINGPVSIESALNELISAHWPITITYEYENWPPPHVRGDGTTTTTTTTEDDDVPSLPKGYATTTNYNYNPTVYTNTDMDILDDFFLMQVLAGA